MLSKQDMSKRAQIGFFSLEDLVPQDHLLRQIDQCIDFSFIYELVKEKYDEIGSVAKFENQTRPL